LQSELAKLRDGHVLPRIIRWIGRKTNMVQDALIPFGPKAAGAVEDLLAMLRNPADRRACDVVVAQIVAGSRIGNSGGLTDVAPGQAA